jgi:hypothetical protein
MANSSLAPKYLKFAIDRSAARFFVSTPVTFTWESANGTESGEGITRDISSQSLYIWSKDLPPMGTSVCCCIYLPSASNKSARIRFGLSGPLIRAEAPPEEHHMFGFVVVSDKELRVLFPA